MKLHEIQILTRIAYAGRLIRLFGSYAATTKGVYPRVVQILVVLGGLMVEEYHISVRAVRHPHVVRSRTYPGNLDGVITYLLCYLLRRHNQAGCAVRHSADIHHGQRSSHHLGITHIFHGQITGELSVPIVAGVGVVPVSYTHLRAHETKANL